jgi:hypothetical protein
MIKKPSAMTKAKRKKVAETLNFAITGLLASLDGLERIKNPSAKKEE